MVTQVASLSRSGVSDWVIQRVSSLLLAAYTLCLLGFVLSSPGLDYQAWAAFFDHTAMQIFSLLTLLALCAHAWIGLWTVGTDYLREAALGRVATGLRRLFQVGTALVILAYLLWGIRILWGS